MRNADSIHTGILFDIKRFAINDGPGIRTTVFFKGCPLNCAWCHNPESQAIQPELITREARCMRCLACINTCPHNAITFNGSHLVTERAKCYSCGSCVEACWTNSREIVGVETTVEAVIHETARDRSFYEESGGGVTLSGGEPLMQPEFLLDLLTALKREDIHTALDTCGFCSWEILDAMRKHVDLFLYDLKLMDTERHRHFTGTDNGLILSNLQILAQLGHSILIRVPVIPGINDDLDNFERMGAFITKLPAVCQVNLLAYHNSASGKYLGLEKAYQLDHILNPSDGQLIVLADILRQYGLLVKIG